MKRLISILLLAVMILCSGCTWGENSQENTRENTKVQTELVSRVRIDMTVEEVRSVLGTPNENSGSEEACDRYLLDDRRILEVRYATDSEYRNQVCKIGFAGVWSDDYTESSEPAKVQADEFAEPIHRIHLGMSIQEVQGILGLPLEDIGSGVTIHRYLLDDGREAHIHYGASTKGVSSISCTIASST